MDLNLMPSNSKKISFCRKSMPKVEELVLKKKEKYNLYSEQKNNVCSAYNRVKGIILTIK